MIAYVKGILEEITENNAVVDVGGIGYNIKISAGTMNLLPGLHKEVKLYTYTCVREDSFSLYGFLTKDELEIFRLLISVSGVGPKGALGILSVMSAQDLRFAVLAADSRILAKAPGIGKKTAERLILELRDKVSMEEALESVVPAGAGTEIADVQGAARNEAVEALVALGYGSAEALHAVSKVSGVDENDTEAILKAALKLM